MPLSCSVPECHSNYKTGVKASVFSFPKDETILRKWLDAVNRKDFCPTRFSRVCELHFEPNLILREASGYDPRTGRTLTAPLQIPRLRKDAVPTLFMPPPGTPVKSRRAENKLDNRKLKNQLKKKTVKLETEETQEIQLAKLLQTDVGTGFQNGDEKPFAIKQELNESVEESSGLVIENVLCMGEMSSNSSSFSSSESGRNVPPLRENALPIANIMDQALATIVSQKISTKIKLNDAEPDANDGTPDAALTKLCPRGKLSMPKRKSEIDPPDVTSKKPNGRTSNATGVKFSRRTIPSARNKKLHPFAGTAKKPAGRNTLRTKNGESANREMFQSLLDASENNPLFGSRTTERPGDLFDVFADFIADKLREMDWDDCAYALRAILDVVFKNGQFQHDSEIESDIF